MKNLLLSLVFALLANIVNAQSTGQARLIGSVDNYPGEGFVIAMYSTSDGRRSDTITVNPNGTFEYSKTLEQPTTVLLHLQYHTVTPTIFQIYMTNGKTNRLKITTSVNEAGLTIFNTEFSGDNHIESEYMHAHFSLMTMAHPELTLGRIASFQTFREHQVHVRKMQEPLRALLNRADAEFKARHLTTLDNDEQMLFFRFAWAKRQGGERMDTDSDFVAFAKSIDLNNPDNRSITAQVIRWYLGIQENPNNESSALRQMRLMKQLINNESVLNHLSREVIRSEMSSGGSADMAMVFELYKQITTDTEELEEITALYLQLTKLAKGAPAVDFEMQDRDGNTVRFLDVIGNGRVVFIDFWATWCGPCRLEKPHLKRLAEKHKDNPNIEFIGISLDDNLNRWRAYLDAENLSWQQFVIPDNFNSTFAQEYNVRGIPRFMAFDGDGNIITINAPRPSSSEIETFLESL